MSSLNYSFSTRFGGASGTHREELIAAAHASCFSIALSVQPGTAGMEPTSIESQATSTMEVPGMAAEKFQELADSAKKCCPIARLRKAEMTTDSALVD